MKWLQLLGMLFILLKKESLIIMWKKGILFCKVKVNHLNNQSIILNQRENKISSFVQKQVLNRTSTEHGILTKLGGSFFPVTRKCDTWFLAILGFQDFMIISASAIKVAILSLLDGCLLSLFQKFSLH